MKNYSAIILSAGYSSRMEEFKPLMILNGKTLIKRCIELFKDCGIDEVIVVTGYQNYKIKSHLKGAAKIVVNEEYESGMFSSVQAGAKVLQEQIDAFFILPVDIPGVKTNTIKRMIDRYEKINDGIVFPSFNMEKGHPTLISASLVKEILEKNPSGGLREILNLHKEKWNIEEVADRGILLDMDTKDDYKIMSEYLRIEPFPDYDECLEILRLSNTKIEIIKHMISVSEFSKKISRLLNENNYSLNIEAVQAGALLHDIAKGENNHAEKGAEIVKNFGYGCLYEIISEHTELKRFYRISEKEIVYVCDKLIKETNLITLDKRFEASFCKYENDPAILKNVKRRYEDASKIKEIIEKIIGDGLENLR